MARFLIDGEWYDELAPRAWYESEFEQVFLDHAQKIFPGYHVVKFRTLVRSETGEARPDYALISHDYGEWWIVEVEMNHHSFTGHVLPQVRILSQGAYGEEHAEAICREMPSLEPSAIRDMLKGKQPRVLVILDGPNPEWAKMLAMYGASLSVFQVFRSDRNKHAFRVNGEQPKRLSGVVSRCSLDPLMPRLLRIESPAALGTPNGQMVNVRYQDQLTMWQRVDVKDSVWLTPISANPLQPKVTYELIRVADGSLELRLAKP